MATRFYFHGGSFVPSISPAYDSEWDRVNNAVRRLMSPSKLASISGTYSDLEGTSTSPYDILARQLISRPLKAQTISGTVKGQLRCSESNAAADMCAALVIKVVSGDGSVVRGTLLRYFPANLTSEYSTSLTNRYFPPETSVTPVTAQEGDVLVIELGTRAFNTSITQYIFYLHFLDDPNIGDLPVDQTTQTELCPWIEFSADIQFADDIRVSQNIVQVEYTLSSLIYNGSVWIVNSPSGADDAGIVYDGSVWVVNSPSGAATMGLAYDGNAWIINSPSGAAVWNVVYDGNVGIFNSPSCAVTWDVAYNGSVWVVNSPSGAATMGLAYDGNAWIINSPSGAAVLEVSYDGNIEVIHSPSGAVLRDWVYNGSVWIVNNPSGAAGAGIVDDGSVWIINSPSGVVVWDVTYDGSVNIIQVVQGDYYLYISGYELRVTQCIAQVEYTIPPELRVTQCITQVEYTIPPELRVTQCIAQVEYTIKTYFVYDGNIEVIHSPSGAVLRDLVYNGNINIVQAVHGAYYYLTANDYEYIGSATIGITVTSGVARDLVYHGQVGISHSCASVRVVDYVKSGQATILQIVSSIAALNLLEYSGLVAIRQGVASTRDVYIPALNVTGDGAVTIAGEGTSDNILPGVWHEEASGGVTLSGDGEFVGYKPAEPSVLQVIATGGVRIAGLGISRSVRPGDAELTDLQIVASGGVLITGKGEVVRRSPSLLEVTAEGGVRIGRFQIPPAAFIQPGEEVGPSSRYVLASGGMAVGGAGEFQVTVPPFLPIASVGVRLVVGGAGGSICIYPAQLDVESDGVVVLGDEVEDDVYDTWAFTGVGFEPSIYTGYNFNSYTMYRNRYYGAKHDGIYLLEGETDDGAEIHSGVRVGPTNFGVMAPKHIRAVYIGNDSGVRTTARMVGDSGQTAYAGNHMGRLGGERFYSRTYVIDIEDFERLGALEFLVLARMEK